MIVGVQGDHNKKCGVHQLACTVQGFHEAVHLDLHGGPANVGDFAFQNEGVVQTHGLFELKAVHGRGGLVAVGVSAGYDARHDVDLLHELTAEQAAGAVDVAAEYNLGLDNGGVRHVFHGSLFGFHFHTLSPL